MTLTSARGPLSDDPAGTWTPALDERRVYAEPHPLRVQAFVGDRCVIDTEDVMLVHRGGGPMTYAFRPEDVAAVESKPERYAEGRVRVAWDAVDRWVEEGRELIHYPPNPYHRVDCRPTSRRLRVEAGGEVLVDTTDTVLVFETAIPSRLYVHPDHVRTELLTPNDTTSYCNYKGWATYWTLTVGDLVIPDAAWSYEDALPESKPIEGHLSFYDDKLTVTADVPAY